MPKQKQKTNEAQQDKHHRPKLQPPALTPGLSGENVGLPPLPGSLLAAGANATEAQAARLGDTRLQTAQRQTLAAQIGQTQGNQHLQRVVVQAEAAQAHSAGLKKSAGPAISRQAEAVEAPGDDLFDEFMGGSGSPGLAPPPPSTKNGQKMAVQRDETSLPPLPNFTLTPPSLLQPPDPASRYRLGGEQTLQLDPEIQAQINRYLQQQLDPANLRSALSQIQLDRLPDAAPETAASPLATSSPGAAGPAPAVPAGPGPATPRAATAGDLMGAILAVPAIDSALTTLQSQALDQVSRDWRNLGSGGQIATVSTLAVIGLGALGGAMSDPAARQTLLDQLNGRTLPVPGLNWMRLEVNTGGDNLMLGMHVDVGRLLPAGWGFGPSSPPAIGGPPAPQPAMPGQRTADGEPGEPGPDEDIGSRIQAKAGGGRPLDESIQRRLESGLGADLSQVRVHTDREADDLAQSVSAVAFTTGQDIFFRQGTYNPTSTEGLKLLAHEATHTLQQAAGPVEGTPTAGGVSVSDPSDRFEQAAEAAAEAVVQRQEVETRGGEEAVAGPAVQRTVLVQRQPAGQPRSMAPKADKITSDDPEHLRQILEEVATEHGMDNAEKFVDDFSSSPRGAAANDPQLAERIKTGLRTQLAELKSKATKMMEEFERLGLNAISEMLNESEKILHAEAEKYGLHEIPHEIMGDTGLERAHQLEQEGTGQYTVEDNEKTQGMAAAAAELAPKRKELDDLTAQQQELVEETPFYVGHGGKIITDPKKFDELGAQIRDKEVAYNALRARLEAEYPLLAAFASEKGGAVNLEQVAKGPAAAGQMIADTIRTKLKNIDEVREGIADGKVKVWKLPVIVNGVKGQLGYTPGTLGHKLVEEKVTADTNKDFLINMAIAAVSIALGLVAAVPTGGASLGASLAVGAAAVGGAVISGIQAIKAVQAYQLAQAMNGSAVDKAKAISQEDPSLFWVALDIVGAILDIYGALKTFRQVAPAVREALAARRAVSEMGEEGGEEAAQAAAKAKQKADELKKSLEGVPEPAKSNIINQVEGPQKGWLLNPDKPMSSGGFAGSLANRPGCGVFEGHIPQVPDKTVVIKIYPADDEELMKVFAREKEGAAAAAQTSMGPKYYGEVDMGPGKKAFAMEKVSGEMAEDFSEGTSKQAAKEASKAAQSIRLKTLDDVRAYGNQIWEKGYYCHGDLQGLIDEAGNWRPIDFQGVYRRPPVEDVAATEAALKRHKWQVDEHVRYLIGQMPGGPYPLPDVKPPPVQRQIEPGTSSTIMRLVVNQAPVIQRDGPDKVMLEREKRAYEAVLARSGQPALTFIYTDPHDPQQQPAKTMSLNIQLVIPRPPNDAERKGYDSLKEAQAVALGLIGGRGTGKGAVVLSNDTFHFPAMLAPASRDFSQDYVYRVDSTAGVTVVVGEDGYVFPLGTDLEASPEKRAKAFKEREQKAFETVKTQARQASVKVFFSRFELDPSAREQETFSLDQVIERPGSGEDRRLGFDSVGQAAAYAGLTGGAGAVVLAQDNFYFVASLRAGSHELVRGGVYQVAPSGGIAAVVGKDGSVFPLNQELEPDPAKTAYLKNPQMATPASAADLRAIAGIQPEIGLPKPGEPGSDKKPPEMVDLTPEQAGAFIISYFRARGLETLQENEAMADKLAETFAPTKEGDFGRQQSSGVSPKAKKLIDSTREMGPKFRLILEAERELALQWGSLRRQKSFHGGNSKLEINGQTKFVWEWIDLVEKQQKAVVDQKNEILSMYPLLAQLVAPYTPPSEMSQDLSQVWKVAKWASPIGLLGDTIYDKFIKGADNPYDESLFAKEASPENDEAIRAEFLKKLDAVRQAIRRTRSEMLGDEDFLLGMDGLRRRVSADLSRATGKNQQVLQEKLASILNDHAIKEIAWTIGETVVQIGLLFVPGGQVLSAVVGFGIQARDMDKHLRQWDASKAAVDPATALFDQQVANEQLIFDTLAMAATALDLATSVNQALGSLERGRIPKDLKEQLEKAGERPEKLADPTARGPAQKPLELKPWAAGELSDDFIKHLEKYGIDAKTRSLNPDKVMKACGDDWNAVKKAFLEAGEKEADKAAAQYFMHQMTQYRASRDQAILDWAISTVESRHNVSGLHKSEAVGSTQLTSDLDFSIHGPYSDEVVKEFNKRFREIYGKESALVFDTNVYTSPAYLEYPLYDLPGPGKLPGDVIPIDPATKEPSAAKAAWENFQSEALGKARARGAGEESRMAGVLKEAETRFPHDMGARVRYVNNFNQDVAAHISAYENFMAHGPEGLAQWKQYQADLLAKTPADQQAALQRVFQEVEARTKTYQNEVLKKLQELYPDKKFTDKDLAEMMEMMHPRPGQEVDPAKLDMYMKARNTLYEEQLGDLAKLKRRYEEATDPAEKMALAAQIHGKQSEALYFAAEAYQSHGSILAVVQNIQKAKKDITNKAFGSLVASQAESAFFEQYGKTLAYDASSIDNLFKNGKYTERMAYCVESHPLNGGRKVAGLDTIKGLGNLKGKPAEEVYQFLRQAYGFEGPYSPENLNKVMGMHHQAVKATQNQLLGQMMAMKTAPLGEVELAWEKMAQASPDKLHSLLAILARAAAQDDSGWGGTMPAESKAEQSGQPDKKPPAQRQATIQRSLPGSSSPKTNGHSLVVQRFMTPVMFMSDEEKVKYAIENKDPDTAKMIYNYKVASWDDRFKLIELLVRQWWVGPSDESALEALWGTFGTDLYRAASQRSDLWAESLEKGAELDHLEGVKGLRAEFAADVLAVAHHYLDTNYQKAVAEIDRLGLADLNLTPTEEQLEDTQDIQAGAAAIAKLQAAQAELRTLPVGYNQTRRYIGHGDWEFDLETATFDPENRPDIGGQGMASWDTLKAKYDELQQAAMSIADLNPALGALFYQMPGSVKGVAEGSPQEARAMLARALQALLKNIAMARPKLGDDVEYYDLKPIHQQLFSGLVKGTSGKPWNDPFLKAVAENDLAEHEERDFWIILGLSTAAAAAFIIAEIASGGTATFFFVAGAGLSATQPIMSWERYLDLAQLTKTNLSSVSMLVSQGQVNQALLSAILDSAFALIDLYSPAKAGLRALRGAPVIAEAAQAGAAAARLGVHGLEDVAKMGLEEAQLMAQQTLEKGVLELGVAETSRRSGKSLDELLQILYEGQAKQRVQAYKSMQEAGSLLSKADLPKQLRAVKKGLLSAAEADKVVLQAIEEFGPVYTLKKAGGDRGWKGLADLLGNESEAGRRLFQWREEVWSETQHFVRDKLGGQVERTGSQGKFSNDLDMSFLGQDAAANRDKAKSFLAGRLGVGPDEVEKMLNGGFFTDPRRMHLYDLPGLAISAETREQLAKQAARYEEEAIWSFRISLAEKSGDEWLAQSLRLEMEELGISAGRIAPLNKDDIARLYAEIDKLHGQLDEMMKLGEAGSARQAELIDKIAQKQAHINVLEKEGYFSGGGVRQQVTAREAHQVPEFAAATQAPMLASQLYTNVLDQLPKMQKAVAELEAAMAVIAAGQPDLAKLRGAIKAVGKYTGRFHEGVGEAAEKLGLKGVDPEQFFAIAEAAKSSSEEGALTFLAREAQKLLGQQEAIQTRLLAFMREQAGLSGLESHMARIQMWTRLHLKFLRARDQLYLLLNALPKIAKAASETASAAEGK